MALLLGQVRPYKGVSPPARAWPPVAAALPGARLFVVGEAYDDADLDRLEGAPGVEVRRGFVPEDDLDRWSAAADVLVLPYAAGSHSGVLHRGLAGGHAGAGLAPPGRGGLPDRGRAGGPPRSRGLGRGPGRGPGGGAPRPAHASRPPGHRRGTAEGTVAVYREVIEARAGPVSPARSRKGLAGPFSGPQQGSR